MSSPQVFRFFFFQETNGFGSPKNSGTVREVRDGEVDKVPGTPNNHFL